MKKFLSLVLALVMTMSLVTVSAGAKDFGDSADLSGEAYEEAVNVMSEMGIIDGYSDGDFRPQGTLTRQAAAKIIACMMLGKTTAESLGTSAAPFKDVPAGSSFAGYIAFCVERGLISGYADGTFRPTGTLTGFAFLKMLLGALGYDQSIEGYTGTNWTVNVAGRAYEIGLTDGNDNFVGSKACTREEAALYAVNTLQATLVEYENKGSSITINGIEVVQGASAPTYVTSSIYNQATSINDDKDNASGDYTVEFAERYQTDLRLDAETDAFERPARVWSWKGEEIGTYVDYSLMVAEYTTSVTGKELYDAIGKTAYDKYDFYSYVDGDESDLYKDIARNNKGDVRDTGNGALTQAFVDVDDESVVVTVVNTYLAQATSDYNEKKDSVNFKIYDDPEKTDTVSGEDFNISDIEKDDFFLVTYAVPEKAIQSIDDVEILSDVEISRFTSDDKGGDQGKKVSSVTADGTKYDAAEKLDYEEDTLKDYTKGNLKDSTYNIYLDQYGYAIGVELVEGADNYVFISGIDTGSSNLTTKNYEANAIFLDGTSKVIDVKNNEAINTALGAAEDGSHNLNTWFTYTVNSSNVYTLGTVASKLDVDKGDDVAQHHTTKAEVGKIDDRHISLNGGTGDGKIYGNDDSIYLIAELDSIRNKTGTCAVISGVDEMATGIDNVSVTVKSSDEVKSDLEVSNAGNVGGTFALYDEDGYVIAAVVVGESTGVSQSIAFAIDSKASSEGYANGMWTWTRDVIINGEEVELTETNDEDESDLADVMKPGQWWVVKYDADGNVKKVEKFGDDDNEIYVKTLKAAAAQVAADEDLLVVDVANAHVDYKNGGRTVYNHNNDVDATGIRVDTNVKIVFQQVTDNRETTDYYEGYDALASILDELNKKNDATDTNEGYRFAAVIEDGRATSIIIIDDNHSTDHDSPGGGTSKTVTLKVGTKTGDGVAIVEINGKEYNITEKSSDNSIKVPTGENVTVKVIAVGNTFDITKTKVTVNGTGTVLNTKDGWTIMNIADGDVLVIDPEV